MRKCQRCESERVLWVSGKTSDLCHMRFKGVERDGYVPKSVLGGGDYLEFNLCLDCGRVQGNFPAFVPGIP